MTIIEEELETTRMTMLKHCARKGLGVALLPEFSVLDEIHNQAFIRLQNATLQTESGVLVILNKNRWISPELRAFMDICEKEITII